MRAISLLLGILFLGEQVQSHHIIGLGLIIGGLTVRDGRLPNRILRAVSR